MTSSLSPSSAFSFALSSFHPLQSLPPFSHPNPRRANHNHNCKKAYLIPSKSQKGNILTPLSPLSFPNSYPTNPTKPLQNHLRSLFDKNSWVPERLHVEALHSATQNGTIPTNQDTQVLDLFDGNSRLPVKAAVDVFTGNGQAPTKTRGGFSNSMGKSGKFAADLEARRLCDFKGCGRIPIENKLKVVDSAAVSGGLSVTEHVDSIENERMPVKELVGFVCLVKKNSGWVPQEEVVKLNLKENGRVSAEDHRRIVNSAEKNDRLSTQEEMELSNSVERSGRSHDPSINERSGNLPPSDEAKFVESVVENCKLHAQEEAENSISVEISSLDIPYGAERYGRLPKNKLMEVVDPFERNGRSVVLDIVDRIKRIPAGEQIEILDFLGRDGERPTIFHFNDLLIALVKADRPESALNMFSDISTYGLLPDSWTFSITVRSFCSMNEPNKAKQILHQMIENGFRPNVVTFTILINSFCKRGRVQKAIEIFEVMHQIGCEPTVQTYNCLINGLCFVGRIEDAYELLVKIKKSSKKPDIYTFTALMDGFCKVGRSDEGMELLEESRNMGLKPTVVTYNTLFDGYCREGRPLEGIGLLREMEERGCEPDFISYSTLLHGLLKWNETHSALIIYKKMCRAGFRPEERVMNTLLRRLCRKSLTDEKLLRDAEELFGRIEEVGSGPTPYTCCLMIQALSIRGQTDKALTILCQMIRTGYPPRTATYHVFIQALCNQGRVDDAWLVLVLLTIRGRPSPNRISYNLLLDEFNRHGRLLDACKVLGLALKRGVFLRQSPTKRMH